MLKKLRSIYWFKLFDSPLIYSNLNSCIIKRIEVQTLFKNYTKSFRFVETKIGLQSFG